MRSSSPTVNVALFPIPDAVAFPGTVLPLHVFEPRYRKLVHDCVRDNRMVGVSHVLKTIHEPQKQQTLEQALNSNQATFKPREVFSAGTCKILETTSDGRIIATVTMSERLALVDEIQSLPYRIVSCAPLEDDKDTSTHPANRELQHAINNRLVQLIAEQKADMAKELQQPAWTELEPSEYSFKVFQFIRFDADVMQAILESQNANVRLDMIWNLLSHR